MKMWYVLLAIVALFALYLGCCFLRGFIQGLIEGWTQPPRPTFRRLRCLRLVCLSPGRNDWHG